MPTALELLVNPALGLVREVRPSQLQMAASVQEVLDQGGVYVAEGPVGIGKTFAYLTPTLMAAGRRVVIATAKKSLQDQIETKDLPTIAQILGVKDGVAHALTTGAEGQRYYLSRVIKGKSNYACRLLAEKHTPDARYNEWISSSRFGDRADFPGAPPPWWPSATAEECVGRACKHYTNCGYVRLKLDASQTRVMVVNHHLLGSDMYFGLGKLVGGPYDVLIIDEAHKFAEGLRAAFTLRVTEHAIADLDQTLTNTSFLFNQHKQLLPVWSAMFAALPNTHWRETHLREAPVFPMHAEECHEGLQLVDDELARLLKSYGISGHPSESEFWEKFSSALEELNDDALKSDLMVVAMSRRKIDGLASGIKTAQGEACAQKEDEDDFAYAEHNNRLLANTVIYGHADRRGRFTVAAAPVNVGGIAHNYLSAVKSVIITSATLAVDGEFAHLDSVIGVKPTKTEILPTSFDYDKQGFAFVPEDVDVVGRNDPMYGNTLRKRIDYCVDLIKLAKGGAFILTTANDELDAIGEALLQQVPYPVFVQGHAKNPWHGDPKAVLQQFNQHENAVLVGSKSFWEGVDVPGNALRLVIITKLPFPSPQDPFIQARTERAGGGKVGWARVSYVDMMIDLRQGVGRLIRTKSDKGVVAILDSRIWTKPYGRRVRLALQFPITSDWALTKREVPRYCRPHLAPPSSPKGSHVAIP